MHAEDVFEERRLFPRLYLSLPFEYQALLSDSGEFLSDPAFLKDISLTGLHFLCETRPKLNPGDIADFIFKFQQSDLNPLIINEIRATGLVKRIEPPLEESPHFGVVVEFLSGPNFKYADY